MSAIDLGYPDILTLFGRHAIRGRSESRAFLGWFLEHYFRLDQLEVEDSICDGYGDRGIDGIYVDSTLEEIFIFQTKLRQRQTRTLGDSDLREFAGSLGQFASEEGVKALAESTSNTELRSLLIDESVAEKVKSGYEVSGVFVTNAPLDKNGKAFSEANGRIVVYDKIRLEADWLPMGDTDPVHKDVTFNLDGLGYIEYKTERATVYMASLRATELVQLAGIDNQALFAWNVRQSLGRTKVNKAIAESVSNRDEHKNFMLYHNGLTILAKEVELNESQDQLYIDRYSVVNGAQSLSTLHAKRAELTPELRLLARVVALDPATELAGMITRNSNNQNSIGARDLQSNSVVQRRLREEFYREFRGKIGYEIKRGERSLGDRVVTNEEAAKVLLAFDLEQPWTCHQSYKHFDQLHSEIFARPVVTARRILGLVAVRDAVVESLGALDNQLLANYSVTRYFVMYLLKGALQFDSDGREFCKDPGSFIEGGDIGRLSQAVRRIADDLIVDVNAEITERAEEGDPFDHKRELKSPKAVRRLRGDILPSYEKAISRNRATSFAEEWARAGDQRPATN